MYLGWYPLSNAKASCVTSRSSRRVTRTRAKARFSKYPRSSELTRRAIEDRIVAWLCVLFHKLYYPQATIGCGPSANSSAPLFPQKGFSGGQPQRLRTRQLQKPGEHAVPSRDESIARLPTRRERERPLGALHVPDYSAHLLNVGSSGDFPGAGRKSLCAPYPLYMHGQGV
jgi:hypothetical protein